MKKTIVFIIITLILLSLMTVFVSALSSPAVNTFLRAGSGGGGGGGGGGFGSGFFRRIFRNSSGGATLTWWELLIEVVFYVFFVIVGLFSIVAFYFKFIRSYIQVRRFIKQTSKSDNAWKFENILSDVREAYFSVQNAWTNMDMSTAKDHMEESLLADFQLKLDDMERVRERNVLEKIKLIKVVPVFVYDNENNENDFVWFYIKGCMIDYTINTDTQKKVSGTKHKERFVEYWRFVRREDKWVLSKILQSFQAGEILF